MIDSAPTHLSPEVQKRLDEAREKQFRNARNRETLHAISQRAVAAIIAPFESGKTTLSRLATQIAPDEFHYVPSRITRERRDNEPDGTMQPIPDDDEHVSKVLDDIARGDVVQYAIHPTEGTFYGTYVEDYDPTKYNLIPMLAGRPADYLVGSPFRETQAIGIVSAPTSLKQRIKRAYRDQPDEKLHSRLVEGINSVDYLIKQNKAGKLKLVHNIEGKPEQSAHALIETIRGERESDIAGIVYLERTKSLFERMIRAIAINGEVK